MPDLLAAPERRADDEPSYGRMRHPQLRKPVSVTARRVGSARPRTARTLTLIHEGAARVGAQSRHLFLGARMHRQGIGNPRSRADSR
jgi:hypothetical protein